MSLAGVIGRRVATYSVEIDNGESITNGEVERLAKTSTTKSLAIFRLTFKDLMHAPEGQWDSNDIKMYEIGAATITAESTVTFEGDDFNVMRISNRDKDGGFTMYWAKRVGVNEASDA